MVSVTRLYRAASWRVMAVVRPLWQNNPVLGLLFDLFVGTYRKNGCKFIVPRDLTSRGFRGRFLIGVYERQESQLVRKHISPRSTVLELGACMGVVSCLTNRMLEDKKRHVVVEANPELIPILTRNRNLNACEFQIENCLVSRNSDGSFYLDSVIVGGSAKRQTGTKITVPVMTLEDLVAKHAMSFNVLVMDIEGGELDFLEENRDHLQQFDTVIVELHGFLIGNASVEKCRGILSNSGLQRVERMDIVEVWSRNSSR